MDSELNLFEITKRFRDAESARVYLEAKRWPNGPVCPHCGGVEPYKITAKPNSKRPGRAGLYKCKACRKQFTVTVGTIFEDSHIPLDKWLIAIHLMCASKKGISAHQLYRMLGTTYRSAWFMGHRIRYAMTQEPLAGKLSGIVEVDETYVGGKAHGKRGRGAANKVPVVSLVERGGRVRSVPMTAVTGANLKEFMQKHVTPETTIMTDEFLIYRKVCKHFGGHETVSHGNGEYARGRAHVNSAESYFSLLKRGIIGTFHHVSPQHLGRYIAEFDFRHDARRVKDGERTALAIGGFEGKRLMLKDPRPEKSAEVTEGQTP